MHKEPARPVHEADPDAMRLRLVSAASDTLSGAELLSLSLHEAVTELDGLGGMAHLCDDRGLRLVAVNGLSREVADAWDRLRADAVSAPAAAVREQRTVWLPLGPGEADLPPSVFAEGACAVAVPLPGPESAQGTLTLTVLLARPGPPRDDETAFLSRLAAITGDRLARHPSTAAGPGREPEQGAGCGPRHSRTTEEIGVGAWEWDPRSDRITADAAAIRAVGLTPDRYDERAGTWLSTVHPDDAPAVRAAIERAMTGRRAFAVEYRVRGPDGRTMWVEARGAVGLRGDGEPARLAGTIRDVTAGHTTRDAMEQAVGAMPDGFLVLDDRWRVAYANREAERLFGGVEPLPGRELWALAPDIAALRDRCASAVADGREVSFDIRVPGTDQCHHMRLVPSPTGPAVYITDLTGRTGSTDSTDSTDITGKSARRLAEPFGSPRQDERHAVQIGELIDGLAQALTVSDVVGAMVSHLLPLFDATGLMTAAIDGRRLRVVGSFGYDKTFTDKLDGMTVDTMSPATEALRSRAPMFVASAQEYIARYPHLAGLPALARKQAWAFLPLLASGRSVGYCALAFDTPRTLGDEERTLLIALTGLVAHAFERARLHDAEHRRAQELQRGLLPRTLPVLPAMTGAARYVPAGPGTEVGGDWYDMIPLSSERVALVVGDVMGHGVSEAVTMGRLRASVRTLADLDVSPDELLAHLDSLITTLGDSLTASCLYAVYDPTTCVLAFASAGHPPPAILHPGGSAYFPPLDPNPPLGLASPPFSMVELVLPPESLVVLYTNGLVQSPTTDIDAGLAGLGRFLTDAAPEQLGDGDDSERLEALCRSVTTALLPPGDPHPDDAVVLVARSHALNPRDMVSWSLPEHPVAAGQARELVRTQLADWDLDELSTTTELLVSELVGNVIRHAEGPVTLRMLRGRTLICEVSDSSLTTPRIRHAGESDEGGRGLQLVAALSYRWGARFTTTGKYIWTEQRRPGNVVADSSPPPRGTT